MSIEALERMAQMADARGRRALLALLADVLEFLSVQADPDIVRALWSASRLCQGCRHDRNAHLADGHPIPQACQSTECECAAYSSRMDALIGGIPIEEISPELVADLMDPELVADLCGVDGCGHRRDAHHMTPGRQWCGGFVAQKPNATRYQACGCPGFCPPAPAGGA